MIVFEKPEWRLWYEKENSTYKSPHFDRLLLDLTEDQINAWKKQESECNSRNHKLATEENNKRKEALKEFLKTIPATEVVYRKYLTGKLPLVYYSEPYNLNYSITEPRNKLLQAAQDKKNQELHNSMVDRAVAWLLAKGKVIGQDFTVADAIKTANDIAFEEEVKNRKKELGNDAYTEFSGQNCDSCLGWDGVSPRCECGNRRVSWSFGYGHSFETPSIEAEAY